MLFGGIDRLGNKYFGDGFLETGRRVQLVLYLVAFFQAKQRRLDTAETEVAGTLYPGTGQVD
jgi:hypothetical protein